MNQDESAAFKAGDIKTINFYAERLVVNLLFPSQQPVYTLSPGQFSSFLSFYDKYMRDIARLINKIIK